MVSTFAMTGAAQASSLGWLQFQPKQILKQPIGLKPKVIPPVKNVPLRTCNGPDPAISGIKLVNISTYGQRPGFYRVLIRGSLINAGKANYDLSHRPILISLRETPPRPGAGPPRTKRFGAGQLSPVRGLDFSFPLGGLSASADFTSDYIITLEQRSPTGINPQGAVGDCRPANNRKVITGREISAAIQAHLRTAMQITRVRACVHPGRSVIIDGHNFGNSAREPGRTSSKFIRLAQRDAEILSWTDRQLIIKAPAALDPDQAISLTIRGYIGNSPGQVLTSFTVRTCPTLAHTTNTNMNASDFHFGTMRNPKDGSRARGVRPLLVLLLQARPGKGVTPALTHDAAYYEKKVFGPTYPNVIDLYKENSYFLAGTTAHKGRGMTWRKAAIIGPVIDTTRPSRNPDPDLADREDGNRRFTSVQGMAAANGFDFGRYDRNRDGVVSEAELGILVVDNFSHVGGVTSANPGCVHVLRPSGGRVSVCAGVSFVGQNTNVATFAHELSHQLNTIDLYGTNCLSNNLSLMSCTAAEDLYLTYLDPWHRGRLGWLKPRIYSLNQAGSALLREPSNLYGDAYNGGPIILYDPRRGPNEYFMIEYRARQRNTAGKAYGYDADIERDGVIVWSVKTDASGNLLDIPDRVPDAVNKKCGKKGADGIYRTTQVILNKRLRNNNIQRPIRLPGIGLSCGKVKSAVVLSPGGDGRANLWGGSQPWTPRQGDFAVQWLNSANTTYGPDAGINLRVYNMGKGYARIRWDPK